MAKLEGYSKVAVIKYGSCKYCFAIYDDGNEYQPRDYVVVSGSSPAGKIEEIISVDEAAKLNSKSITAEVIGKVDISAYEKRVEQRKEKEELKKQLDKRRKEIQKRIEDERYAEMDETFAEMLRKYEELG